VSVPEAAGGINATEAADGVPVLVTLPAGAVAGDVITVSIDGSTPVSYTVTAADVAAPATPISVLLPAADITAAGQGPATITTTYADAAGNAAAPVTTAVDIDTIAPGSTDSERARSGRWHQRHRSGRRRARAGDAASGCRRR
jgi:hypothetical protein